MFGLIYKQKAEIKDPVFSLSMNYVAEDAMRVIRLWVCLRTTQKVISCKLGGEEKNTVCFAYRYGQCGTGERHGSTSC